MTTRQTATQRGYGARWRIARAEYLAAHPWCVGYGDVRGGHAAATVVDHKRPHKGDQTVFWDRTNWQGLCASCHSRKTANEDGGFGNPGGARITLAAVGRAGQKL